MRWQFLSLLLILSSAIATAQESPATVTDNQTENPEASSIRTRLSAYAKAINEREFDSLRSLLDPDVVYIDVSLDIRSDSRDTLISQIESALEDSEDQLKASIDSIEFTDPKTATVIGSNSLGTSDDSSDRFAFSLGMVKSDEGWVIKSITESNIVEENLSGQYGNPIAALGWMEGEWKDEVSDLTSKIRYMAGGEFLVRTFSRDSDYAGFQVIGYDASDGVVRSWSYFMDGTFGEAIWSAVDGRFMAKTVQKLSDGRTASGTYVIAAKDADTMSVKLVGHSVNGVPVPSASEMIVRRVTDDAETPENEPESEQ